MRLHDTRTVRVPEGREVWSGVAKFYREHLYYHLVYIAPMFCVWQWRNRMRAKLYLKALVVASFMSHCMGCSPFRFHANLPIHNEWRFKNHSRNWHTYAEYVLPLFVECIRRYVFASGIQRQRPALELTSKVLVTKMTYLYYIAAVNIWPICLETSDRMGK